jgi:hypothetical protein
VNDQERLTDTVGVELAIHGGELRHRWTVVVVRDRRRERFQKSACAADQGGRVASRRGMIVDRVVASALPGLCAAAEPAVVRPLVDVQGRRAPGTAPRSCRLAESESEASDGLGGSSDPRRARRQVWRRCCGGIAWSHRAQSWAGIVAWSPGNGHIHIASDARPSPPP